MFDYQFAWRSKSAMAIRVSGVPTNTSNRKKHFARNNFSLKTKIQYVLRHGVSTLKSDCRSGLPLSVAIKQIAENPRPLHRPHLCGKFTLMNTELKRLLARQVAAHLMKPNVRPPQELHWPRQGNRGSTSPQTSKFWSSRMQVGLLAVLSMSPRVLSCTTLQRLAKITQVSS